MNKTFDIVIIGGGVAGMTAAVYAKRRGKSVCIIEKFSLGGQVNTIPKIENFPSFAQIDGFTLAQNFANQIEHLNIEVVHDDIQKVDYSKAEKAVFGKKNTYLAKSVIIASGLSYVELGLNENEYLGKGASYCAVCDANFFKDEAVCVASKSGSGLKDALVLAEVCSKVTVLDSGDMTKFAQANKNKKIEVISGAKITKLIGKDALQGVEFKQSKSALTEANKTKKVAPEKETQQKIAAKGLFIALGKKPDSTVFGGVKVDKSGFIVTDENMRTTIPGVFAVGDVRSKVLKQIVTACADGAIAGQNA